MRSTPKNKATADCPRQPRHPPRRFRRTGRSVEFCATAINVTQMKNAMIQHSNYAMGKGLLRTKVSALGPFLVTELGRDSTVSEINTLKWAHGEKNLLGDVYRPGISGGFVPSSLVGSRGDDSHTLRQLVGGLPQQLVLIESASTVPCEGGCALNRFTRQIEPTSDSFPKKSFLITIS
jgi:hypothetical protein